ncbi:hypothetical protein JOC37_002369 [Desulfohalotomaculum tongense]|uniref:DUF2325 domain-containing protein n=1 Tax=Desulforadius tongensis TaxID=1216062 RepID=UPI00195C354F|nr:DUF2325 domain-containing protein [Desulforadius tongensis]MBM7855946.1 hypothetical protein [Desulforadius tongensis]
MSIFVVGGDRLGNINQNLSEMGFDNIIHTSGRKKKHYTLELPEKADCVLVFTDYICHNTCKKIKKAAKSKGVPIFFCRRSWSHIKKHFCDKCFQNCCKN